MGQHEERTSRLYASVAAYQPTRSNRSDCGRDNYETIRRVVHLVAFEELSLSSTLFRIQHYRAVPFSCYEVAYNLPIVPLIVETF